MSSINNTTNQAVVFYNKLSEDVNGGSPPIFIPEDIEQLDANELQTLSAFLKFLPTHLLVTKTFANIPVNFQHDTPDFSEYTVGGAELYAKLTTRITQETSVQNSGWFSRVGGYFYSFSSTHVDNTQKKMLLGELSTLIHEIQGGNANQPRKTIPVESEEIEDFVLVENYEGSFINIGKK